MSTPTGAAAAPAGPTGEAAGTAGPAGGAGGEAAGVGVGCEVAIVGCGPVGLVLAILLGQRGRSVTVHERWPQPYRLPRAVHFDHEVGRVLQACGVGERLRAVSEPAEVYEWRDSAGATLLRFGRIGAGPSGWPQSSMFGQPDLEALLEQRADDLPGVAVRRGVDVTSVTPHADHVVVGDAAGGTIRARYVVGCDGANSTVRDLVGIDVADRGYFHDWLIVDVVLDEPRVFDPINVQVCDPRRPTTAVSGGPGRRRWEFMRLPSETLDDLNDAGRAWELLAPWDVHPGNARLERHAVYTFQARWAERWRVGRVLVAGDAAHQMPPFAGQGLGAGVRDAADLAWKLDLVLTGRATDALLDTYEQERLPSARAAIDFSMALGKVICVADPDEAAARDAAMAAAVTGELTDVPDLPGIAVGVLHAGDPSAGQLFVQPTVDGTPFDDVHGAGWRLITVDPAGAGHRDAGDAPVGDDHDGDDRHAGRAVARPNAVVDAALIAWFATIGGAVVALPAPDERTAGWFAERGVTWVLQRPDFHVFGTATRAAEATALLADLRRQLIDGVGLGAGADVPTASDPVTTGSPT